MARITVEISDELAQRLAPFESNLSELLSQLFTSSESESGNPQSLGERNGLYQEILDFLVSQPSPDQIVNFKVSDDRQRRLASLLTKNQDSGLTLAESSELDLYEQLDTLIGLLKVRAYESLKPVL